MHSACGKQPHAGHFNYIGSPPRLTIAEKNTTETREFSLLHKNLICINTTIALKNKCFELQLPNW